MYLGYFSIQSNSKRDKREVAYSEVSGKLDITVADVKTKINNLRAQLGREINKVKKTKSGQSTDELYKSSWLYFQRLQFLVPQMQPAPRRDTLELSNTFDESDAEGIDDNPENVQPEYPKKKRTAKNRFEEKRIEILNKCSNLLTHKPSSVAAAAKRGFIICIIR